MRLVSHRSDSGQSWLPGAMRRDGSVVDLSSLEVSSKPGSVRGILGRLDELRPAIEEALESGPPLDPSTLELGPPVPDPDKVICIGLNYLEHAGEVDMELPAAPILFPKFRNSLIGSGAPIPVPPVTNQVDYEGELGVVIGQRCRNVGEEEALEFVAGYMPVNDVSARDLQMKTSQWTAGKALDGFAPCGPALVTADEVDDVQDLDLTTRLNGEVVQESNTSLMIFPVKTLIAFISSLMTLEPGDVIASGTPSGVGFTREPPLFMHPGDRVAVEIEGIGVLSNPVGVS